MDEAAEKHKELGRPGGVWYELEIMQPDGPDDFQWVTQDTFGDYERATWKAWDFMNQGHGVRVIRCEDRVGQKYSSELVWEDGKCL